MYPFLLFLLYNKMKQIFILLMLSLVLISFTSAQPSTTVYSFPNGYTIVPTQFEQLKVGEDFNFFFYLYNTSSGLKIDNSTVNCTFHMADSQGNLVLEDTEVYQPKGYWYTFVNGSYVSETGYYYYGVDCTDGLGGAISGVFEVTHNGRSTNTNISFFIIVFIISMSLLIFGLSIRDPTVTILSSFGLYFISLNILFFGIGTIKDPVYTWGIGLILLGMAFYVSLRSAYELIVD